MSSIKLDDVAPLWNAKIKEDFKNIGKVCERDGHEMDIMNNRTCMLGEVWGWDPLYSDLRHGWDRTKGFCEECDILSQMFGEIGEMQIDLEEGKTSFIYWNIMGRKNLRTQINLTQAGIKRRYNETVKKLLKHIQEKHPKLI
jgi:hypothetical protein